MPRLRRTLIGALLIAALIPSASAGAPRSAPSIKGAWSTYLPDHFHGTSVAIAPDGVPWFGLLGWEAEPPTAVARVESRKPTLEPLPGAAPSEPTAALQFDSRGALWFAVGSSAIARRDPDGTVTKFALPAGEPVNELTLGPEGDVWFVRGGYEETAEAQVGRLTPAGVVTQIPLEAGSRPASITVGPDGAIWFSEELAGEIGRVTTNGVVQLFPLAPYARPRQIIAGPDGALWFGENARARRYGKVSDRIGRITVDGQVSELPIPFGRGTSRFAADPRGVIWFTTEEGEFSSISPSGNVGARGCVGRYCETAIESLTVAPGGALWFAGAVPYCGGCGGGSGLILMSEPTKVGKIPAGALTPADPAGPPARDPFAEGQPKPPPPIARTGGTEEVDGSSAALSGYVNPRGFPTNTRFKWGTTKAYGHRTFLLEPPFTSGEGGRAVGTDIFGLCPLTTYHYEVVAYGPGGRALGGDRTFTTRDQKYQPKHCSAH
jgi:virginiamycin B lyase